MRAAEQSVEKDWAQAQESVTAALEDRSTAPPAADAPAPTPEPAPALPTAEPGPLNGGGEHTTEVGASEPTPAAPETQHAATPQVEKSGA